MHMPGWDCTPWFWYKWGYICVCSSNHRESLWRSSRRFLPLLYFLSHWLSTTYCWKYSPDADHGLDYLFSAHSLIAKRKGRGDLSPLPFLWFNKAHLRSLIQAKGCCIQAFQTNSVTSSEQSHWRVLVNGGNSVPGGLTQDWDRDRTGLGAWCVGLYFPRLSLRGSIYMYDTTALWQWITFCFYAASCCLWRQPLKVRNWILFFFSLDTKRISFLYIQWARTHCLPEAGRRCGWDSRISKFLFFAVILN